MKNKIVKTFESFVANKNFKFEESIINPILEYIRDNQDELTKKENLPILAKLGYMYNTLWYAGRLCWGYDGELRGGKLMEVDEDGEEYTYGDCEDNPKYKIEMCNPHNEQIEDLIYDAWSMHVSNDFGVKYEDFYRIVYEGEELSDHKKLYLKVNKTLDDWVEIMTHKDYEYRSKTRKEVLNHLLCVIGNGFTFDKNGFLIGSGGAGVNSAEYGDWKNAKFTGELKKIVDNIMSMPELKATLEKQEEVVRKSREEREKSTREVDDLMKSVAKHMNIDITGLSSREIMDRITDKREGGKKKVEKYKKYYPISRSSDIYTIVDKESLRRSGIEKIDPSYIKGAIEVCNDILAHQEEEEPNNVKMAKTILSKIEGTYVEFDKYGLLEDIKIAFLNLTDNFGFKENLRDDSIGNYYNIYINDTAQSQYADNNYHLKIICNNPDMPKGFSNNIDYLKDTSIYSDIVESLDKIRLLKDIKEVLFYYTSYNTHSSIDIDLYKNSHEYQTEIKENEKQFVELGFEVGKNLIRLNLPKVNLILETTKPKPLGSKHPNNKDGKGYFSLNKPFYVIDGDFKLELRIDERGVNLISGNVPRDPRRKAIYDWVLSTHKEIKDGNSEYGTYSHENRKNEGKLYLYAHTLMMALRDNQDKLKI